MKQLSDMKLYYKKLFDNDTPIVTRFGTTDERKQWKQGGNIIINTSDTDVLKEVANKMGKIRSDIHKRNENDTNYRLCYLQYGTETIDDIKKNLGEGIANVVRNLRQIKK